MNEIEFRAWDTTLLKMLKPLTLEEIFNGDFSSTKFDQLVFMQYTGCKDSNSVKIFTGDILFFVYFYEGKVKANTVIVKDSFTVKKILNECSVIKTTVVGNIYENEELVKDIQCV